MFRSRLSLLFFLAFSCIFLSHCTDSTPPQEQLSEQTAENSQEKTVDAAIEPTSDASPSDNRPSDEPVAEKSGEVTPEISPENSSGTNTAPVKSQPTYEVKLTTDLVYAKALVRTSWSAKTVKTRELKLDVYEPRGFKHPHKPVLVVIHGGGFKSGSKSHGTLSKIAKEFTKRGFVCFSLSYRLEGDYGNIPSWWPAKTERLYPAGRDVKAALRWIRANATKYGIDPDAIAAMGSSAGAGLAIALGISFEDDFVKEQSTKEDPTLKNTHLQQKSGVQVVINNWGGTWLTDVLTLHDKKSRFGKHMVPMLTFHGAKDKTVSVEYAYNLQKEYKKYNRPYELYIDQDAGHGAWNKLFDGKSITQHSMRFVIQHLKLKVE
jgi:predicted esterase